MCACRFRPASTSVLEVYWPPFQPGSEHGRLAHDLGEEEVVWGVLRGAGDRGGAQHLVREPDRPLVRLLGTHRPADHQRQPLDAEVLAEQPFLRNHVVADPDPGELRHGQPGVGAVRVVRRDRQAAADLVDRHDKVPLGVQRVLRANVDIPPNLVRARVPGSDQDGVVPGLVQLAPGGDGELAVRDGTAFLQVELPDAEQVVITMELVGVERAGDTHAGAPAESAVAGSGSAEKTKPS